VSITVCKSIACLSASLSMHAKIWPSFARIMLLMLKADVLSDTQRLLLLPVPLVTSVAESVHQTLGFVATSEATDLWHSVIVVIEARQGYSCLSLSLHLSMCLFVCIAGAHAV